MMYSIIIPISNAERYLPACLDSVLVQEPTSEYEVILMDDGSTISSDVQDMLPMWIYLTLIVLLVETFSACSVYGYGA